MTTAKDLIARLDLQPHPEGGWYRETWRTPSQDGGRADATAIHFLLTNGQRSHWHTVDAAEIWLWHAGDPLALSFAPGDAGPVETVTLGGDVIAGQQVQHVIAPGHWQAAGPAAGPIGFTLVSCVVAPGFEFSGFHLAEAGWEPGA
uniref:cupin domain-containing protein n=1 Tax=Parerythrobacter lutipelagi TaxID=1964208 RepID=UPI0010F9CBDC|nr:cupin domain-containing protein [Parerythrobacter lutipelagi]